MIECQIVSWHADDSEEDDHVYTISIFGRNKEGDSVSIKTTFQPFFFVLVPDDWTKYNLEDFKDMIEGKLPKSLKEHLLECFLIKKKKFYGFTNDKYFTFVALKFQSKKAWKNAYWFLKRTKYCNGIYEANIDPMLRFIHIQGLETTGWLQIDEKYCTSEADTSCSVDISVSEWKEIKFLELNESSKIITASFDIETYSPNRSFPDPLSKDNDCPVIQIATSLERYGEDRPYLIHIVNLGTCDPIEDYEGIPVELVNCKTESELLTEWQKAIKQKDPDILTGYNIWKFDLQYIYKRCKKLGLEVDLSRLNDGESKLYNARFSSSAYGTNDYEMVDSIGRTQIDLLELIKRDHKLPKYSLNFVSATFLKDNKIDLDAKTMFTKFEGNSSDRREIALYCIKDTLLPLDIIRKLNKLPNLIEMAKVTYVPLSYLLEKGQQIKVFSQITKQTRLEDMLVVTPNESKSSESFTGATVLDAQKGAYMTEIITGLDFASLYPTIMRAHNLCYNSIVLREEYKNLEDVEYKTVDLGSKQVTFVQNRQGILPKILQNLALSRKKAKKDMNKAHEEGDKFKESLFNGKQLAFKVSMNSIYGFCAAFMLPCQEISAAVTTIGREMIEQTKEYVEKNYEGSRVVYGDTDSVMVIFDVSKENTIEDKLKKCFELGNEAAERITGIFKKPIELEMEKCYWPYLLFAKKRYAGQMYTKPEKPDYIDVKGLELVRRDNPDFVKDISREVLDIIMKEQNVQKAIDHVRNFAKKLLNNKIDMSKMTISKSLRDDYVNMNQPHILVAQKIKERQPGSEPKAGDRVPYVFIKTDNPKDKLSDKAEDPKHVIENALEIDTLHYLDHCLVNPMCTLFEVFMENPKKELFEDIRLKHIHKKHNKSIIYYI